MNKTMKRLLTAVLALVMLCMAVPAAFADDEITPETGTQTIYLRQKEGTQTVSVDLARGSKDFTIKRSSIKVTPGDTGAEFYYLYKSHDVWGSDYEYEEWDPYSYESTTYSYSVTLRVNHSGTAKVSYKIGKKSYTVTLKVKAYVNPVTTITLTGVNKGKNFASKCKTYMPYEPSLSFPSVVKSATLKVVPKTGWKLRDVSFYDDTTGTSYSKSNWNSGLSSVSLKVGKPDPTHKYSISINFVNSSNGASLNWYFRFGNLG